MKILLEVETYVPYEIFMFENHLIRFVKPYCEGWEHEFHVVSCCCTYKLMSVSMLAKWLGNYFQQIYNNI